MGGGCSHSMLSSCCLIGFALTLSPMILDWMNLLLYLFHLVMLVLVYDTFRNPLQGYLTRRAIKAIAEPKPDFQTKSEAQMTAFSVLSRRKLRPSDLAW